MVSDISFINKVFLNIGHLQLSLMIIILLILFFNIFFNLIIILSLNFTICKLMLWNLNFTL